MVNDLGVKVNPVFEAKNGYIQKLLGLTFSPIVWYNYGLKDRVIRSFFIMISHLVSLLFLSFILKDQIIMANTSQVLASREFSLGKRYEDSFVNNVFKDNILLTIDYISGKKVNPAKIDWATLQKPFEYKLVLKPGETFAFHDDVLPEFDGKVAKTTNAHFNFSEGFKSSGYLVGDGVCHLASLLYWVAKDAGLETVSQVKHDFANIPEVPKEYGVSIYAYPGSQATDKMQNLYITNNREREVAFVFDFDGQNLKITAVETL